MNKVALVVLDGLGLRKSKFYNAVKNANMPYFNGLLKKYSNTKLKTYGRWVGLEKKIWAYPDTLSGGEKQRVAIARAVINRPQLLLADEPTGNVDDEMAKRLLYLFLELNKLGTTVVIATHNKQLIKHFGFPELHLKEGRLEVIPENKYKDMAMKLFARGEKHD